MESREASVLPKHWGVTGVSRTYDFAHFGIRPDVWLKNLIALLRGDSKMAWSQNELQSC